MCRISEKLFVSVPVSVISGVAAFLITSYVLKSDELKTFLSNISRN